MDEFLHSPKPPKLRRNEQPNKPISNEALETGIKSFQLKKVQNQMDLQQNATRLSNKIYIQFLNYLKKWKQIESVLLNSSYEVDIILIPKPGKINKQINQTNQTNKNYRPVSSTCKQNMDVH